MLVLGVEEELEVDVTVLDVEDVAIKVDVGVLDIRDPNGKPNGLVI